MCWYTQPVNECHWRAQVTHKLLRPITSMMLSNLALEYSLPLEHSNSVLFSSVNSGLFSSCTGLSQRLQIATHFFTLVGRRVLIDFSSSSSKVIGANKNENYCNFHSKTRTCCVSLWKTTAWCAVKKLVGIDITASLWHMHLPEDFFQI